MIKLLPQHIRLGVRVRHKEEAIRAAGQALVDSGHIAPAPLLRLPSFPL